MTTCVSSSQELHIACYDKALKNTVFVSPGKFVSRLIISLEQLHDLGHSADTDPGDLSDPLPDWITVYNGGL